MSSKKPPKVRRQKIANPKPAAGEDAPSSLRSNAPRAGGSTTESLTVEQRQAIQAMAAQGLSKSTIAAALNIEGDLLGLEQLPETRVGRVAHVLFSDIEQIVGLKEG